MKTLKHEESRLVRPFLGWDDCQKLLSDAAICLRPGEAATKDESVTVRIQDAPNLEPTVFANIEKSSIASALASVGLSPKDVEFNIFVKSPGLKKSIVAYKCPISEIPAEPIPLVADKVKELIKSQGGIDLTLALTLAKKLDPKPLGPFFFGAWMARKVFSLRPEVLTSDFITSRLTDEKRKEFGLPKGTTYWVQMHGGSLNDAEENMGDVLSIWVDESVLDRLARSTGATSASSGFQIIMVADVICGIVFYALSDPSEKLVPKSPLDSLLEDLSKSSGIDKTVLVRCARNDQFKFRTYVQHMTKVSSSICSAT